MAAAVVAVTERPQLSGVSIAVLDRHRLRRSDRTEGEPLG